MEYCCSIHALPHRLYRVDYPGSQTIFSDKDGFRAADTTTLYSKDKPNVFKEAVVKHLDWNYRGTSPFISLFSDQEHAQNWACKEPWRSKYTGEGTPKDSWTLCVIDPAELSETFVFQLKRLEVCLDFKIPNNARQNERSGEYLCLHKIPITAIIEKRDSEQVHNGKGFECLGCLL
jgi:hypothetical protein